MKRNKYSIPTITPDQALAQLARVRLNAIMRAVTGRSIKRVMKRKPQITGAALRMAMKEWYGIDYGYRVRRPANARKVQSRRHGVA